MGPTTVLMRDPCPLGLPAILTRAHINWVSELIPGMSREIMAQSTVKA